MRYMLMRYMYHGIVVESGKPLDSTIFQPVKESPPTGSPTEPEIAPAQLKETPKEKTVRKKNTVRRKSDASIRNRRRDRKSVQNT